MDYISVFIIAIGLAMDAFAVSVSNGVIVKRPVTLHMLRFGVYFGVFQFVMPLIGFAASRSFSDYIVAVNHWVTFLLLGFIGGKMIWEALAAPNPEAQRSCTISAGKMATLAIATSVDALAVGIGFAVMDVQILGAAALIGVVAFVFSAAGIFIGHRIGCVMQQGAAVFGGVILILIGARTLIEDLFFH